MTVKDLIEILNQLENHDFSIQFIHEFYCEIESITKHNNNANIYEVKLK